MDNSQSDDTVAEGVSCEHRASLLRENVQENDAQAKEMESLHFRSSDAAVASLSAEKKVMQGKEDSLDVDNSGLLESAEAKDVITVENLQGQPIPKEAIKDADVLCIGKSRHNGNKMYQDLVQTHANEYASAGRSLKTAVAKKIVDAVHAKGGRFLKRDDEYVSWFEISDETAMEKVKTAFCFVNRKSGVQNVGLSGQLPMNMNRPGMAGITGGTASNLAAARSLLSNQLAMDPQYMSWLGSSVAMNDVQNQHPNHKGSLVLTNSTIAGGTIASDQPASSAATDRTDVPMEHAQNYLTGMKSSDANGNDNVTLAKQVLLGISKMSRTASNIAASRTLLSSHLATGGSVATNDVQNQHPNHKGSLALTNSTIAGGTIASEQPASSAATDGSDVFMGRAQNSLTGTKGSNANGNDNVTLDKQGLLGISEMFRTASNIAASRTLLSSQLATDRSVATNDVQNQHPNHKGSLMLTNSTIAGGTIASEQPASSAAVNAPMDSVQDNVTGMKGGDANANDNVIPDKQGMLNTEIADSDVTGFGVSILGAGNKGSCPSSLQSTVLDNLAPQREPHHICEAGDVILQTPKESHKNASLVPFIEAQSCNASNNKKRGMKRKSGGAFRMVPPAKQKKHTCVTDKVDEGYKSAVLASPFMDQQPSSASSSKSPAKVVPMRKAWGSDTILQMPIPKVTDLEWPFVDGEPSDRKELEMKRKALEKSTNRREIIIEIGSQVPTTPRAVSSKKNVGCDGTVAHRATPFSPPPAKKNAPTASLASKSKKEPAHEDNTFESPFITWIGPWCLNFSEEWRGWGYIWGCWVYE